MSLSDRAYREIKRFARDDEGDSIVGTLLDFVLLIALILILVVVVPRIGGAQEFIDDVRRDWGNSWKGAQDWWNGLWGQKLEGTEEASADIDSFAIALSTLKEEQSLPFSSGGKTYVAHVREFDPTEYGYRNLKSIDFYTTDEWANYTALAKRRNEQYFVSNPIAFSEKVSVLLEKKEGWTYVTSDGQLAITTSGLNPETERNEKGFLSATMTFYISDTSDEQFINDTLALEEGDKITYMVGIVPYNIFMQVKVTDSLGTVNALCDATLGYGSIKVGSQEILPVFLIAVKERCKLVTR